eukprot:COSAG01_NODE_7351_length_3241_cov_2.095162_3_plen_323_part_00
MCMWSLPALIVVGAVWIPATAALPQQQGEWFWADLLSRVSLLEQTFHTRQMEMNTKFTAQHRELEAAFAREASGLRREFEFEVSRLRAALDTFPGADEQQHHVVAIRRARLQDTGESLCSSTNQATAALRTVKNVCCTQRGESCSSTGYPTSCDHGRECGVAVHTVNKLCAPFLKTSILSTVLIPLQQAAQLCAATSPPEVMAVYRPSDASRGGTLARHACFTMFKTQVGGKYRNNWNSLAVLQAPAGFQLSITWRAFDLSDGDFIDIFENSTALQARRPAQRLEGKQIPPPFTSQSNTVLIKFITNADGTSFGASANITCV